MKTEHELLKEIIDLIWYEFTENKIYSKIWIDKIYFSKDNKEYVTYDTRFTRKSMTSETIVRKLSVREIIFTPEFNNKMLDYLAKNDKIETKLTYALWLMNNLYNPVSYLATILNIKQD